MKRLLLVLLVSLVASASAQKVDFGYVEWPGVTVKTHVASQILEALGYDTSMRALSVPITLKGVSEGDLDVFLGVWRPSMNSMIEPYLADTGNGSITLVARNLEPTVYRPAVPSYVAEQGITSLADVAENAEMFDGKIYGIEPGNDGNEIIRDMIENDTYGFANMEIVESSTQGMLTAVERATKREEPIVFLAWSPHWMNTVHDISYLDDPENVWGGDGFVATAVNSDFAQENPELVRFFERFAITPEVQSDWIDNYSRQGNDPAAVARNWLADNVDTVQAWVEGLETSGGDDAAAAVQNAFGD
jgi:glycine betaine/proline transport system substrate-binding protein